MCLRGVGPEDHPDPGAVGGAGQEGGHHCGGEPGGVRGILQLAVNTALTVENAKNMYLICEW